MNGGFPWQAAFRGTFLQIRSPLGELGIVDLAPAAADVVLLGWHRSRTASGSSNAGAVLLGLDASGAITWQGAVRSDGPVTQPPSQSWEFRPSSVTAAGEGYLADLRAEDVQAGKPVPGWLERLDATGRPMFDRTSLDAPSTSVELRDLAVGTHAWLAAGSHPAALDEGGNMEWEKNYPNRRINEARGFARTRWVSSVRVAAAGAAWGQDVRGVAARSETLFGGPPCGRDRPISLKPACLQTTDVQPVVEDLMRP